MSDGRLPERHPVERLLMPLEPLGLSDPGLDVEAPEERDAGVRCITGQSPAEWLLAGGWRVYASAVFAAANNGSQPIQRFRTANGKLADAVRTPVGGVHVPFSIAEAYRTYVHEQWTGATHTRRLSPATLNIFYRIKHIIPRRAQLVARRALVRRQGLPSFPAWPYDDSVGTLLRFTIRCSLAARNENYLKFHWFWPAGFRAAAILTHDVESPEGLRIALRVAELEQGRGVRSSFNIVGDWYPIDWGIVDELRARGFELGTHGVYHDRSLFSSRREFERQVPLLRAAASRLGAEGFRSPATHRVQAWIADLPFHYDCTVPLSDPYEPQPGGCCSPWPFFIGDVVELPYTLPQDHTLFSLLRQKTVDVWIDQVKRLERSHGLIQCLSHPDPGYLRERRNLDRYAEFLDFLLARDRLWLTLPREVARWWVARDGGAMRPQSDNIGTAELVGDGEVQLFAPD